MERIRRAQDGLTAIAQKLADAAYRQSRSGSTPGQQATDQAQDGDVVDAEFEDTDRKAS
jgi:hypothetical protein